MSPRLPVFRPKELLALLEEHGFRKIDQKGSHLKMRNDEGDVIIVPIHQGRDMKRGLVLAILKQAGIDPNSIRE